MRRLLTLLIAVALPLTGMKAQAVITVAQDGSGDYNTVQQAIDAVAEGQAATIRIKAGTYEGMVKIGTRQTASTKKIALIGDGMDKTKLTAAYGKNNIGNGKDVRDYATLAVFAPDFYAQDLCIENAGGKAAGQALALHVDGDCQTFLRCYIKGYQDTHRTKKGTRSYYRHCVIEGATDFIYAGGTCWFEQCTLNCVDGGYITAPEDITAKTTAADGTTTIYLGFIFNNCTVTKADGVSNGTVYLGRPWNKDAAGAGSIYMNCDLGGIINAAGWQLMSGSTGKNTYFAEYGSKNAGNTNRVAWSFQMTDADYDKINTWTKVDALVRGTKAAYDPEAVIAAYQQNQEQEQQTTADDYTDLETGKLLAFPTARGFGKYVSGGRGGKVVEVTRLDDDPANPQPGSLRWALQTAGKENATIVFRVSGIIKIEANAQKVRDLRAALKNVTIAGQTAPGDGILIRGGKVNLGGANNVIMRNLRFRTGEIDEEELASPTANRFIKGAGFGMENASNAIIDHCCFGWSGEENMTVYDDHFLTVQWCILHEGLYDAGHQKGARSFGNQWGGSPATYHHNLLAHNYNRSSRLNGASSTTEDRNVFMEYQNNVNYNWGNKNSCYGGENEAGTYSSHECNFIANYYKPGPSTPSNSYFMELSAARSGKTLNDSPSRWYFSGNVMEGNATATANNWQAVHNNTKYTVEGMKSETVIYPSSEYTRLPKCQFTDYDLYRTPAETAEQAYETVLAKAGTINRDQIEQRVVDEVRNKTAQYKGTTLNKAGFIDSPDDAEGWPTYVSATPYADNDHDGMDDTWETAHGFDPNDPDDGPRVASAEGYTALEIFLNSLMGEYIPVTTAIRNVEHQVELKRVDVYGMNGTLKSRHTTSSHIVDLTTLPQGVYLVRKTYTDGSVQTVKVARQ